ncbi:PLDc N-terminal domain-containing protein [Nesterenkonia ebinurensis]|uniref:PLDc N-terminal domain-containing protein n=1 Tax=Nesterenkonia ebinurensis TaxID=2608252 RepID=UPI00123CBC4C|nr:PLDc N-terminal domain-containing protein [Nesterenkonia ebinurensis]
MTFEVDPLIFIPVTALLVLLIGWCLVDIIRSPRVRYLPKIIWALIVLLTIPIGPILYLLIGRNTGDTLTDEDL